MKWNDGSTLRPDGILARLVLLVVGFTLLLFLQLWGFYSYLVLMVIYCRFFAAKRKLKTYHYPAPARAGGWLILLIMGGILLILIASMFFASHSPESVDRIFKAWNQNKLFTGLPKCENPLYSDETDFYSCRSILAGIGMYLLLTPVLVAILLCNLIKWSQVRISVSSTFILCMAVLTLALCMAAMFLPQEIILEKSAVSPLPLLFYLLFGQFVLAFLWSRASIE